MRWYAERPDRIARQVVADVVALLWTVLAVTAGVAVHDGLSALRGPGDSLVAAGGRVSDTFTGVAGVVGSIPFIGPTWPARLDPARGAGTELVAAGGEFGDAVGTLATGRWSSSAGDAAAGAARLGCRCGCATPGGPVPPSRRGPPRRTCWPCGRCPGCRCHGLVRVAPDPAAAWRSGDPAVVAALAALELSDLGLHARPHD